MSLNKPLYDAFCAKANRASPPGLAQFFSSVVRVNYNPRIRYIYSDYMKLLWWACATTFASSRTSTATAIAERKFIWCDFAVFIFV